MSGGTIFNFMGYKVPFSMWWGQPKILSNAAKVIMRVRNQRPQALLGEMIAFGSAKPTNQVPARSPGITTVLYLDEMNFCDIYALSVGWLERNSRLIQNNQRHAHCTR